MGSRTRLCLLGKLRASEAAGEVGAAPQRGRLVQGSQPGPAFMLGPAAHCPRAGPGGEPHSLTVRGMDCTSFSAPPRTIPSPLLPASAVADRGLPSQAVNSLLQSLFHWHPTCLRMRRLDSGLVPFPTTGKLPSGASGFRGAHCRKAEARRLGGTGARKVSV